MWNANPQILHRKQKMDNTYYTKNRRWAQVLRGGGGGGGGGAG